MKLNWPMILSIVVGGLILVAIQALTTKKVSHCDADGKTVETVSLQTPTIN